MDPGVWIHSGVCRLDSHRSLRLDSHRSREVGVFPESVVIPEFEVTPESGVCIHSGAPNLESLRGLESRTNPKYGVWSLDVLRIM